MNERQERYRHEQDKLARAARDSIKAKISSGVYPLETSQCFCGADDDQELKTVDRDGIQHRIVVCNNCALVRANPRMTAEAYRQFYDNEYRDFTYRWLPVPPEDIKEQWDGIAVAEYFRGQKLHEKLINEDIPHPGIVVDFGCYRGGMLDFFKDNGSETWGIEFNQDARLRCEANGHNMVASLDDLIAKGVRADLVIMQDVIEHLLDLRDVWKIGAILKPEGYLYVDTPGLFRRDPAHYWQLAHTWYFVANTLQWVMQQLGFAPTYCDEEISSFWQFRGVPARVAPPPQEWVEYIVDEAMGREDRKLPPFSGVCKFTKKLLYGNMRRNFAMKLPDIHEITGTKSGPIAVVSGGPSVNSQAETIKGLYDSGVPVIAIARMYPWCLDHGIIPTYVVSLDCSEEQEAGFSRIEKSTTHLMATVTRPEITEMIRDAGAPIYIFDSRDDRKIKDLRRSAGYEVCTVINSGGTVAITCMAAAFNLGYNYLHVFGLDCMFPNYDKLHADGIAGKSVDQHIATCTVNGEDVLTTPSFIEFARQALELVDVAHTEGILEGVKFYGDSLINKMWDGTWLENEDVAA